MSDDNIIHFNPWQDFNDVSAIIDPADIEPDVEQLKIFLDVVFSYCEGLIPVRGFVDKGQDLDDRPNNNIWIEADAQAIDKLVTFVNWAWREGSAVYVVPGTVAATGQAKAEEVKEMQTIVVDLDDGDIAAKYEHLVDHLGAPTLVVESGGRTKEGQPKLHVWWKLTEPATDADIQTVCRLRGDIARKIGGDWHFRSAHQPIRVAGSVYHKGGFRRAVTIRQHNPHVEVDLREFGECVDNMIRFIHAGPEPVEREKPTIHEVLTTPVREGGVDGWSRFAGISAAAGHYIRLVHKGEMSPADGWEAICQYNAAMVRPPWPLTRLKLEADRLWAKHIEKNGPPLIRLDVDAAPRSHALPVFSFGELLDDVSPMPEDIIAPRILTPGGLLVLGGAPKVGKSDFLISMLVHMAAGISFLGFAPPRPLRIFYLQAEIQYHYLRERMQGIRLGEAVVAAARDNLHATPKLKLILDDKGLARVADAIRMRFPENPPDIICLDPIRNLFDGGKDGGENDNSAMMFFLTERVDMLREAVAPECGVILAHHTRKTPRKAVAEDPFQALSGASALRGFYTSGLLMHQPDEDDTARKLEIELRNGPALPAKLIDKVKGRWVELNPMNERLVRKDIGEKLDAERVRKHDRILSILLDEAAEGRLYTYNQFSEVFENKAGLGGKDTIRDRISVLMTKGFIKYLKDGSELGLAKTRSRYGYLCVEGMVFPVAPDHVDPETGEVSEGTVPVYPTHYKSSLNGQVLEVENRRVWVYPQEDGQ
jgi:AAA domain